MYTCIDRRGVYIMEIKIKFPMLNPDYSKIKSRCVKVHDFLKGRVL